MTRKKLFNLPAGLPAEYRTEWLRKMHIPDALLDKVGRGELRYTDFSAWETRAFGFIERLIRRR